ncbi:MAG: SDR family NAD(P)-dependent oxidoreductase, partial [Gemmatimonadota bacterium]
MQVDLAGKVAVVTGGAGAIGRAIVDDLVANGARVVVLDLDGSGAEVAAAQVRAAGGDAEGLAGDVADRARMEQVAAHLADRYGRLDILVNNAGINTGGGRVPIHQYRDEDWDRILRVDLTGVYVTSRALIPLMLSGGGGRIVNIASVAGLVPLRLQSAFVAAKAGVANLTRSMALELGPEGIL